MQVVNTTRYRVEGGSVHAEIWDLDGACPDFVTFNYVNVPAWNTSDLFELGCDKLKGGGKMVYFLLLKLVDNAQRVVSRNFYWLHQPKGDYTPLGGGFRSRKIPVSVSATGSVKHRVWSVAVDVKNLTSQGSFIGLPRPVHNRNEGDHCPGVAFGLRLSVLSGEVAAGCDRRILPTFYSDNYFSLVPDESHRVKISFEVETGVVPLLVMKGWNIEDITVSLDVSCQP